MKDMYGVRRIEEQEYYFSGICSRILKGMKCISNFEDNLDIPKFLDHVRA